MYWLKKQYEKNPNSLCINDWTFGEVYKKVVSLAGKLCNVVESESRIAILAENSPELALYLYALLLLKKEVLLLNTRLTELEIQKHTELLNVKVIISSKKRTFSFEEISCLPEREFDCQWEVDMEQIAVIMNTSATTGQFKSVPIRWKQIDSHVKASAQVIGVCAEDNWLVVLPMFHISGLSILFRSLYNGTKVTIMEKYNEDAVLKLIADAKVNMVSLVPTMLSRIVDKIHKHHLRMILLGGEFIPNILILKCMKKGLPVYKTYGMTETTSQSVTFNILEFPEKIDSVGKALPGVCIEIRNKDINEIGEIWIKSPMLMDGYIGMEQITGYFNTDDIGRMDQDGFLYILNRRKDIIISGGENIYPKEIEDLLYKLSGVSECAILGREDPNWGQVPVLYLVSKLPESTIRKYMEENIAKYKIPKEIIYKSELPKNASGKILRKKL